MNVYFSPRAMTHHYLSMASNVVDNDLSGSEVRLKKYFYALRPVLASRWIVDCKECSTNGIWETKITIGCQTKFYC